MLKQSLHSMLGKAKNLQSIAQGHLEGVCRSAVIQGDYHYLSLSTLEIEIRAFQHQTDVISDKQPPNHLRYLSQCANYSISPMHHRPKSEGNSNKSLSDDSSTIFKVQGSLHYRHSVHEYHQETTKHFYLWPIVDKISQSHPTSSRPISTFLHDYFQRNRNILVGIQTK